MGQEIAEENRASLDWLRDVATGLSDRSVHRREHLDTIERAFPSR
jgi:hypothetical protein